MRYLTSARCIVSKNVGFVLKCFARMIKWVQAMQMWCYWQSLRTFNTVPNFMMNNVSLQILYRFFALTYKATFSIVRPSFHFPGRVGCLLVVGLARATTGGRHATQNVDQHAGADDEQDQHQGRGSEVPDPGKAKVLVVDGQQQLPNQGEATTPGFTSSSSDSSSAITSSASSCGIKGSKIYRHVKYIHYLQTHVAVVPAPKRRLRTAITPLTVIRILQTDTTSRTTLSHLLPSLKSSECTGLRRHLSKSYSG